MKHIKKYESTSFYNSYDMFYYIDIVNLPKFKEIVSYIDDIDFNIKDKNGDTPLIHAIRYSAYSIFKFLIESGANVDVTDKFGNTPLILSVRNKKEQFSVDLIESGADLNKANFDNETPLILISHYSDKKALEIIEILIENGADWNITDDLGNTFMMYLSSSHKKEIIEKYPEKYEQYLMVKTSNKFNL